MHKNPPVPHLLGELGISAHDRAAIMSGDPARRGKLDDQGDFYRFIVYDYTREGMPMIKVERLCGKALLGEPRWEGCNLPGEIVAAALARLFRCPLV